MKSFPARRLVLAALALALALLWICSCSDDDCPTCPTPVACNDPAKAFLGTWVVFESTINGSPDQIYMDMRWNFIDRDTLLVATAPSPYVWSANDSIIFIMSTPDPSDEFFALSYECEADTLNLTGVTGMPFAVSWRFHRTP